MKKFISNLCTFAFMVNVFTHTGTTAAIAAEVSPSASKQEVIADIFAEYSMTIEKAEGQVKALAEASKAIKENNIAKSDLVAFAISDMNPAESKAFLAKTAQLDQQNLSTEEAAKIVLDASTQGSNFMGCAFGREAGFMVAAIGGTVAFVAGLLALVEIDTNHKDEINYIKLEKVAIEQEIDILIAEGVSEDSYLITSRKADIAYMNEEQRQMEEKDENAKKKATIMGGIAAAGLVLMMINLGC